MPLGTADPDRIRRIRRESVFARWNDIAILTANPSAKDGFADVRESFFSDVDDAQGLVDELAANVGAVRGHEAAEVDSPLGIGTDIAITPVLPKATMKDRTVGLDANQVIKGIAIDFHTERNSIETIG